MKTDWNEDTDVLNKYPRYFDIGLEMHFQERDKNDKNGKLNFKLFNLFIESTVGAALGQNIFDPNNNMITLTKIPFSNK